MLKEQDKKAIDACVTRPNSVWDAIKSIITAEKYTWYLESLAKVKIMPNIVEKKAEWDSLDTDARSEYMETDAYDKALRKVLQQVARVLGGIDDDDFPIGSFIGEWRKPSKKFMFRQTAFKTAVAFRFTIDETRELLFNVLKDKEQLDFNPRLVDEMIYGYAIIQSLSLVSTQELIENSKIEYLTNVFGTEYQECYPQLIISCDDKYNVFDAQNITKTAFLLAALIEAKNGTFSKENISSIIENKADSDTNDETADDEENARLPKLDPDVSVVLHCYDYANGITQKEPPQYRNSQTTIADLQRMLELAQGFLNAATELAELETKQRLYRSMFDFLEVLKRFTDSQPSDALFSPVDCLPLLAKTNLGNFSTSDFNTMIKDVFINHFHLESRSRDGEGQRVGEYHPYILPRAISEHTDYYVFFFFTLMTAVRDLRAVALRDCMQLWPIYIRMNEILLHAFFDAETIGKKAWDYEQNIKDEDGDYTFTMAQLTDMLNKARSNKKENAFIAALMRSFHIYENFHGFISHGKEEFIGSIDDSGKVLMFNERQRSDITPLFRISDAGLPIPADLSFKRVFYSSAKFKRQYNDKSEPYTRNDILKLAFWKFVGELDDYDSFEPKTEADLRKDEFISYFNDDVSIITCCARINERNPLDRFLLLCLEHTYPILFLEEAISYSNKLRTIF